MTVVKNCATLEDAWLVKNQLENGGIEAEVLDEGIASSAPHLLEATGVRVAVADEDGPAARELLGLPPMENRTATAPRRQMPGWVVFTIVAIALGSLFTFGLRQPHELPGDGTHHTDQDRNGDGRPDKRLEYGADGRLVRAYFDDNFDGTWDTRVEYKNGAMIKCERDLDFDGTFDTLETYRNEVMQSRTVIPGGIGNPLFRYDYGNGVLERKWEDPERDGAWNTCIIYDAMGREIERKSFK